MYLLGNIIILHLITHVDSLSQNVNIVHKRLKSLCSLRRENFLTRHPQHRLSDTHPLGDHTATATARASFRRRHSYQGNNSFPCVICKTMSYAIGYDPADFESDEESYNNDRANKTRGDERFTLGSTSSRNKKEDQDQVELPNTIKEMDNLDIATLEKLGWMEPLGYRALSEITGLPPATLRTHFWASKLNPSSSLYNDINYYFQNSHSNTHGVNLRISRVVELKRYNENNCDYKVPNVRLLWHGTQTANVAGILTNGFRLPIGSGMFGPGVYFADRVSKSAQYCGVSRTRGSKGILFLCAVNLGRIYEATRGTVGTTPQGYDSVMGCGNHVPDPSDVKTHRGAMMPCGRTITNNGIGRILHHNEFIVYELSKIAILFLIEFEYL